MKVTREERGWAGHFICGHRCLFRRNTLLTYKGIQIVVSTVGLLPDDLLETGGGHFTQIGLSRHFETMVFHSDPTDTRYHDMDVSRQVDFDSPWAISEIDADDRANEMHEQVVKEIMEGLLAGKSY